MINDEKISGLEHRGVIRYSGTVSAYNVTKHGIQKPIFIKRNKGKLPLFLGIVRALSGAVNVGEFPYALMGQYDAGSETNAQYEDAFTQPMPFTGTPQITYTPGNDTAIITYTFIVPVNSLSQTEKAISKLQLLNRKTESDENVCAELDLGESPIQVGSITSSLLVYWRLEFKDGSIVETN